MKTQFLNIKKIFVLVTLFVVLGVFTLESSTAKPESSKASTEQNDPNNPTTPEQLGEKVVKEVNRILANLKKSKYDLWGHVDETRGIYDFDCCGFVDYVLQKALPQHSAIIPANKCPRPLNDEYFYFLKKTSSWKKGRNGWRRIKRIKDVLPGNILSREGHTLLIIGHPKQINNRNFRVLVAECGMHSLIGDTRKKGNAGLGTGELWLISDSKGELVALARDNWDGKIRRHPWVIGRPVPLESTIFSKEYLEGKNRRKPWVVDKAPADR